MRKKPFKRRLKNEGGRHLPKPRAMALLTPERTGEEKIAGIVSAIGDPFVRRRAVKHLPIDIMIAKGKDDLEAALFFVIDELVGDIRCNPEYSNSLLKVFFEVQRLLAHADDERSYFHDPRVGALMAKRRISEAALLDRYAKIRKVCLRGRQYQLVNQFDKAQEEIDGIDRLVALVVGFTTGIRAACESLRNDLRELSLKEFENFTIAPPAPEQSSAAAAK